MSHFTTIQTEIRDITALRKACDELGLELNERGEARGYGANRHTGEHVIRLKGPYDIAVNREDNGALGLTCDWWGGHVEREVGKSYGRILQLYDIRAQHLFDDRCAQIDLFKVSHQA